MYFFCLICYEIFSTGKIDVSLLTITLIRMLVIKLFRLFKSCSVFSLVNGNGLNCKLFEGNCWLKIQQNHTFPKNEFMQCIDINPISQLMPTAKPYLLYNIDSSSNKSLAYLILVTSVQSLYASWKTQTTNNCCLPAFTSSAQSKCSHWPLLIKFQRLPGIQSWPFFREK